MSAGIGRIAALAFPLSRLPDWPVSARSTVRRARFARSAYSPSVDLAPVHAHARHFRHPIGPIERSARKLYSERLQRLGCRPARHARAGRALSSSTRPTTSTAASPYSACGKQPQLEDLAELASRRKIDLFPRYRRQCRLLQHHVRDEELLAERIIAFEPDPGNYARLMANLDANDLAGRVEAVPLALGDRASEVTLYEGAKWNRGESTIAVPEQTPQEVTFTVRQARFDDEYAIAGKTIIVKMDVEGYEFHRSPAWSARCARTPATCRSSSIRHRFEELKALLARVRLPLPAHPRHRPLFHQHGRY